MSKIPRGSLTLVADHRDGWFYNSDVGERLAVERSDSEETIRMRRWDAIRMICFDRLLIKLGMPKLTGHQLDVLRLILVRGALDGEHWIWTGMRGHTYINLAIEHETGVDRHNVSRAVTGLVEHDLVAVGKAYGNKPSIRLEEGFHRYCFEAQWREMLRNTNLRLMPKLLIKIGWKRLLQQVDDGFRGSGLSPTNKENRNRVLLSIVQ